MLLLILFTKELVKILSNRFAEWIRRNRFAVYIYGIYLCQKEKEITVVRKARMYVVKNGTVLVSGMVVKTNGESTSVYRIDEPAKSVSTN